MKLILEEYFVSILIGVIPIFVLIFFVYFLVKRHKK